MKISGIYKIINKVNGKYYVGSSSDIKTRWSKHIYTLSHQKHKNIYLQRAWNKYGKNNFEFVIVEKLPKEQLLIVEQKYLDDSMKEKNTCYNLNFKADGGGWNEYSKQKMSKKHSGVGNPMFGKTHSVEIKLKIGISSKNRIISNDTKKKQSVIARIKGQSIEWRRKVKTAVIDGLKITNPIIFVKQYTFFNKKTKETFIGTPFEFKNRYDVSKSYCLVHGKRKSAGGWVIV